MISLSFVIIGCAGATVLVDTTVPIPLVKPILINMGVHYDQTLTDYVHEEDLEKLGKYRIELGSTQVPVFEGLFETMFSTVTPIISIKDPTATVDAIIVPSVDELQFSVPEQTRSDFFEIWIKYNIGVYDNTGKLIINWPLMAYGKSNTRNFGSFGSPSGPGLNEATIRALRDAVAHFSFYFRHVPEIKEILNSSQNRVPE